MFWKLLPTFAENAEITFQEQCPLAELQQRTRNCFDEVRETLIESNVKGQRLTIKLLVDAN